GPPIGLSSDELSHLGVVLVQRALRGPTGDLRRRIVAAHYLRPVARDVRGHVQRLPPAVLGTWDERADRHDHFAWGVASELAGRVGREATDFEREQARRAEYLAGLAAAGVSRRADVRAAIEGYREVGRTSH
ncbi:MAG TPA: hypothetical protein VNJ28_02575, partial [Candidatus Limnocylindrales bacterium]|nr:hypothetical protein [Candidatus Limnocylindrales bacterium]